MPAPSRTVVIANPGSGRDISRSLLEALLPPLEAAQVRWTNGPGHASELARAALSAGARRFVAAGGDGTVNEIASALAGAPPGATLAILPFGTGNDLARSLGIPLELERAAEVIQRGVERCMDLVRVDGFDAGLMANASIGGLGGDLVAGLDRDLKRTWGSPVYLRMALDEIGSAASYPVELKLDEEELTIDLANIVVANGRYLGGGIPVAPEARVDDGLLDVVILPSQRPLQLLALVPLILSGRQQSSPRVIHRRARRVRVAPSSRMPVTIDGEPAGNGTFSYEIDPGALRVICPEGDPPGPVRYRLRWPGA